MPDLASDIRKCAASARPGSVDFDDAVPPPNTATSRIPGFPSSAVMLPAESDDSRFNRCAVAQRLLQFSGRAERDHASAVHQRDAMAVFGFVHVVGGDENSVAGCGKLVDQVPETAPGDGIDAAGGLVQKQNGRLMQDRATEREALFPAPGKQARHGTALVLEAGHFQDVVAARRKFVAGRLRIRRRKIRCSPPR